ncbi:beta-ketoacyl-ACP synthase III [Nibricoccus sp. IMCC34717]|uniref:beta-ketoacyl-ACP synthase III n=1 Tax=Nibricoccus sp. IMCC34717 TaxID=3034021 RepID=UPI00384B0C0C
MAAPTIAILGTGSHAPARVLTNAELSKQVETSDEWITTRTGIRERRIASPGESTSDLAAKAGAAALQAAGLTANDIDLVIVATTTADLPMPACATLVQAKLGITNHAASFDLNAACTGFLYALDTAWAMLASGRYRHALVIGAEKMSSLVDWQDRTTCVLFGDGAGAVVLGPSRSEGSAIIGTKLYCEGGMSQLLCVPAGGSDRPSSPETIAARDHFVKMKGREVFKVAVREMEDAIEEILEQHGITPDQISLVIPHQANLRIIDALAKSLGLSTDRFFINLDRYGNTSAASIPLALDEAVRAGRVTKGGVGLLVAFGAGLTYGTALVRW